MYDRITLGPLKSMVVGGLPEYVPLTMLPTSELSDYIRVILRRPDLANMSHVLKQTIREAGRPEDIIMYTSDVSVLLTDVEGRSLFVSLMPGFITDLASVPPIGRWLVSNHSGHLVIPSTLHDLFTSTHMLGFERNNELLRETAIASKVHRAKARVIKFFVSSIPGRACYEKAGVHKREWYKYTTRIQYKGRLCYGESPDQRGSARNEGPLQGERLLENGGISR